MLSTRFIQCVRYRPRTCYFPPNKFSSISYDSPPSQALLSHQQRQRQHQDLDNHKTTITRSLVTITKTHAATTNNASPSSNEENNSISYDNNSHEMDNANISPSNKKQEQQQPLSLDITESCVKRVKQLIQKKDTPNNYFLRLYVDAGGCSGFQYKFELDSRDSYNSDEDVYVGINDERLVVVDKISLGYIDGSTVDYVQELIKSSFVVLDNPHSESACGCGSSFAVKRFEEAPALD